jgi:hypothetical protein
LQKRRRETTALMRGRKGLLWMEHHMSKGRNICRTEDNRLQVHLKLGMARVRGGKKKSFILKTHRTPLFACCPRFMIFF